MSFKEISDIVFGGGDTQNVNNSGGLNVSQGMNVSNGINANYGVNEAGSFGNSTSTGGSTGGGTSFNQSQQNVYGAQAPYLQDVYGQAQGAYGNAMGNINSLTPSVQNQVSSAAGAAAGGYGNQLGGGFSAGLAGQIGPNAYTDAMKGQIANDAMKLKQQSLGSLDARAAAAGMSGSSGYRDQVNGMNNDINENAMNAMTQVGYNSFNQGIQNQMGLASQMDANQQAGLGNLQNIQQGSMNQFNPAMAGLNAAGQYGQIIGGPTVLGSSSGGSQNFNNSFNNSNSTNSSFSNGMNMGLGMNQAVGVNNSYGSNVGSSAGTGSNSTGIVPGVAAGVTAYKSDARLKTNIKMVEQVDGVNMYTWDWKEDAPVKGDMNYGVLAQEVAETHPEAVVTGDDGYLIVDYSKLGRAGEMALSRVGV